MKSTKNFLTVSLWSKAGGQAIVVIAAALVTAAAINFISLKLFLWLIFISLILFIGALFKFEIWKTLIALCLILFISLNYGFANLTVFYLPVGHLLAIAALTLLFLKGRLYISVVLKEPIFLAWAVLALLGVFHLITDFRNYGLYAIRDVSFLVEGIFLLIGVAWAADDTHKGHPFSFLLAFAVIFIVNFLYAVTFLQKDLLLTISPQGGVFREIPIMGFYAGVSLFLVLGSLFFFLLSRDVLKLPQVLAILLMALLFGWSLVLQERSVYIEVLVAFFLLLLVGERKYASNLLMILGFAAVLLFGLVALFGINISGRLNAVSGAFIWEHVKSLFLQADTPGVGSIEWRLDIMRNVLQRWSESSGSMLFGEGFGRPLTDFTTANDVAIRQPHNTHLTVLARLGIIGFAIWIFLHGRIFFLLLKSIRKIDRQDSLYNIHLWFFLTYVLCIVFTSVQPWLEFSYGAIPFYVIVGYAIYLAKSTISLKG